MSPSDTTTVVVTDLDGTFWGASMRVHPTTHDALAELDAAGVRVLIATGRRIGSARAGLEANGFDYPAVLLNGALGFDFASGVRFHEHRFPAAAAIDAVRTFASVDHQPCMYTADGRVHIGDAPTTSPAHLDAVRKDIVESDLVHTAGHDSVLGFSILGVERDSLAAAAEAFARSPSAEMAFYNDRLYDGWSLMVQPPGISKWSGVQAWLAHEGIETSHVVAIGDGGNDIEMLEAADVAVAVRTGDPNAIAVADHVLDDPDDGGWAGVLDLV